jgi:Flp pilus assembly protein TadD
MQAKKNYISFLVLSVLIIIVCSLVLTVQWPALSTKAVSFDDSQYVLRNRLVQEPSWNSAKRFLTEVLKPSTVAGYYQPLTMISLMLDTAMGGNQKNFIVYHRTSLFLHVFNVALIIVLLFLIFENFWAAAIAGLIFGIHPLTVETFVWLGERKTLLAAFFSLWSLVFFSAYTRKTRKSQIQRQLDAAPAHKSYSKWIFYSACLLTYIFALLSKPTSIPLPLMMLLMDWWPLKRLNSRSVLEKMPFFFIAAGFAVIFFISQNSTAGISMPGQYEHKFLNVPLIIFHNIVFYIAKILWPVNLSSFYPYPEPFNFSNWKVLLAVVLAICLIILLIISVRWTRTFLAGWLFFFVAVAPTLQVLRFSNTIASDKFVYLPSIGFLLILGWFLTKIISRRNKRHNIILCLAILGIVCGEAIASRNYLRDWGDSITLYKHMLTIAPKSVPIYDNMAKTYGQLGKYNEAIGAFQHALDLDPNEGMTYYDLGVFFLSYNQNEQAIAAFNMAANLIPLYPDVYVGLSTALGSLQEYEESLHAAQEAIKLNPDSAKAYLNIGFAYANLGRLNDALMAFEKSANLEPGDPTVHYNIATTAFRLGNRDLSKKHYEILKSMDANLAEEAQKVIRNYENK